MSAEEISLDRYFAALWRAKWFIIILTIIAGAAVAIIGLREPTLYTSQALIEVGRVWKEPLEDSYTTAEIAGSGGFLQELASGSGLNPGRLKRSIKADVVQGGPRRAQYPILVRITATTDNSDESVRLAQVVADEVIKRHEALFDKAITPHLKQQEQIEQRLKTLSSQSAPAASELELKLSAELYEVKASNESPTLTEKTRLAAPVVPGATIRPSPWRNVMIAALATFIGACVAAIVIDQFRSAQRREAAK
jgi:hypothetical protein